MRSAAGKPTPSCGIASRPSEPTKGRQRPFADFFCRLAAAAVLLLAPACTSVPHGAPPAAVPPTAAEASPPPSADRLTPASEAILAPAEPTPLGQLDPDGAIEPPAGAEPELRRTRWQRFKRWLHVDVDVSILFSKTWHTN